MPTLEELEKRIAILEARINGFDERFKELKEGQIHLERRIDHLDHKIDEKFSLLDQKIDEKFSLLDQKIDEKFSLLDQKTEKYRDELHTEMKELDKKTSRFFLWMIGIQITILLTIIGILFRISLL